VERVILHYTPSAYPSPAPAKLCPVERMIQSRRTNHSDKVLAVFQGHSHKNDPKEINGIHYCTLVAMVEGSGAENNGYSTMDILDGGTIRTLHNCSWRCRSNRAPTSPNTTPATSIVISSASKLNCQRRRGLGGFEAAAFICD
jgi:hypothetical protein